MIISNPKSVPSKKCVIYARVSSAKQTTDGSGLSSQERTCRDYAERKGYEVVEVFNDVISGKLEDRPGMNALLAFLRKETSSDYVVVVDDFSRLARDVNTHGSLRDKITAAKANIESPNQRIGEDASGRFVETIWAAIAEHQRNANAEQSKRRSLARLKNGYWIHRAPYGYRYEKTRQDGKLLVPDEPLASIVKEALEGFASGRYQSQAEVRRFFESKPEFPKTYRGTEVHFDKVKSILTNPLYAGYIEHKKSGIPLMQARHEGLISFSTHQIILDRLAERNIAPARKDISDDFPLRGFLTCECCGHRLTSCWSTSRSGRKYPYYLCGYRGCEEKGKSIPRDLLETDFSEGLKKLVPARTTFEHAERLFKEAWAERSRSSAAESQRLKSKVRQIERDVDSLVKRLIDTQNKRTISAYENRIADLETEKLMLAEEAEKIAGPERRSTKCSNMP